MRIRFLIYSFMAALMIDVSAFGGRFVLPSVLTTVDLLQRGGDQIGAGTDYFVSKLLGGKHS
jgi:hypothetical protein